MAALEMEDSIALHHQRCYTGFADVLSALNIVEHPFKDSISFTDASNEFDRYKLWCGNVGAAHQGPNYRISLDYRLREAPFYKEQICGIMSRLAETVGSGTSQGEYFMYFIGCATIMLIYFMCGSSREVGFFLIEFISDTLY